MNSKERIKSTNELFKFVKEQKDALVKDRDLKDLTITEHRLLLANYEKQASLLRLVQAEERLKFWFISGLFSAAATVFVLIVSKYFNLI